MMRNDDHRLRGTHRLPRRLRQQLPEEIVQGVLPGVIKSAAEQQLLAAVLEAFEASESQSERVEMDIEVCGG